MCECAFSVLRYVQDTVRFCSDELLFDFRVDGEVIEVEIEAEIAAEAERESAACVSNELYSSVCVSFAHHPEHALSPSNATISGCLTCL